MMEYKVGENLTGTGTWGGKSLYRITKVTQKTVTITLVENGNLVENCKHCLRPDREGRLTIKITDYRNIRLSRV